MSARRITRAALAAGAATAVGIGALALGQQSSSAVDTAAAAVAGDELVGRGGQETTINHGRSGPSIGDRVVFWEKLSEKDDNDRVGRLTGTCDTTEVRRNSNGRVTNGYLQCVATFALTDGQITVQGSFWWTNDKPTLAITGGTGSYDDAAGEVHLDFVNDNRTDYDFDFENNRGGTIVG